MSEGVSEHPKHNPKTPFLTACTNGDTGCGGTPCECDGDIECQFCGEAWFDWKGLKSHLLSGNCPAFNEIQRFTGAVIGKDGAQ